MVIMIGNTSLINVLVNLEMESIPLKELLSLVEDISVTKPEALQNSDLNMRVFRDQQGPTKHTG